MAAESPIGGTIVTPVRRRRKIPLVWIAVTPLAAWAVARLTGIERGALPTQLMTATPYAAAGSLVPLLIAAFRRKRAATAVAVITTTALGLAVLPRAFGDAQGVSSGRPFTVLTVNLLFGRADTGALMELVRRYQPDVLSTQELTPGAVEALDQAGLAAIMPHRVLQAEWSASGSGLFSRHPVKPLWDAMPPVGHRMPGALVSLPGSGPPVEVIAVHPFPPAGADVAKWQAALAALPDISGNVVRVLAGDFNATLDHVALRGVLARGYKDAADQVGAGLVPTWPANKRVPPMITIDHVLVDSRVGVRDVGVHTVPGTDHRALVARLELP